MTTREFLNTSREVFEQNPIELGRQFVKSRLDASIYLNATYLMWLFGLGMVIDGELPWPIMIPGVLIVLACLVIEWATKGTVPASKVPDLELEWLSRKADELDTMGRIERELHVNHDGTISWIAGRADPDPYYHVKKKRRPDFEATDFEAQMAKNSCAFRAIAAIPPPYVDLPAIVGCPHKYQRQEGYGVAANYYCEDCGSRVGYPYGSSRS